MENVDFKVEENGVYQTETGDLVQMKKIDTVNSMYNIKNISEGCNQHLQMKHCKLVKRIR